MKKVRINLDGISYINYKTNLPKYCKYSTLKIENYINDNIIELIKSTIPFVYYIDLHVTTEPSRIYLEMPIHIYDYIPYTEDRLARETIEGFAKNIIHSLLNSLLDIVIEILLKSVNKNRVIEDICKIFEKYRTIPSYTFMNDHTYIIAEELNIPGIAAKKFFLTAIEDDKIHKIVEDMLMKRLSKTKVKGITICEYSEDAWIITETNSICVIKEIAKRIAKKLGGIEIEYIE